MPPWSSHNPSTPSKPSSSAAHSSAAVALSTERSVPRLITQDVPILSSMNSTPHATPPCRRGHSRSISHPSPSPFSWNGRRARKPLSNDDILDSDDEDEEVTYTPGPISTSPRKAPLRAGPADEFLTGKCMACNSTVRWPRALKVFRCTACLTVNDLEPFKELPELPGNDHPANTEKAPVPNISRKAVPLSVERTKAIIDACISSHLQKLLDGPASSSSSSSSSPHEKQAERPYAVSEDGHLSPLKFHFPGRPCSPKRTPDSRSRSPSATRRPSRPENEDEDPSHPTAPPLRGQTRNLEARDRSDSDVQATPSGDPSPREIGRSSLEFEPKDQDHPPPIFKALEEYIISSFKGCDCLNNSFTTARPVPRAASDGNPPKMKLDPSTERGPSYLSPVFEPDAKTLLLGDLAENSSWWMKDWVQSSDSHAHPRGKSSSGHRTVTSRSPQINWTEVAQWYSLIINAGTSWVETWSAMQPAGSFARSQRWDSIDMSAVDREFTEARLHTQRTLMKATENLLKRPRRPLKRPEDTRFLLMLLANPLIYSSGSHLKPHLTIASAREGRRPSVPKDIHRLAPRNTRLSPRREPPASSGQRNGAPGHHSGIIKRILGLMSNLPNDCHHYLVSWFSRFSDGQFEKLVDLVGGFVTYRLSRQHGRKRSESSKNDNSLIPSFSSAAGHTPAELHAAINGRSPSKSAKDKRDTPVVYGEDWQVRAAARVMSLLFTANNANVSRKPDGVLGNQTPSPKASPGSKPQGNRHGHMVPISSFYNTLLDYSDLVADFEAWESKTAKFSFCQYPFFLSIWAKIHILEHDARRQMEVKAREAFFNSILNRKAVSQYLVLKVRRDCLVEDSLRGVSEVVGSSEEDIKKGLRIEFVGEEGVDAGGLRKEWFLLLVREVFDPHHGLFIYDEDSQYCYFNPYCFESSEQFFLVGVLLGLAIYNSTILDVDLPPFAFKKLLAAAPQSSGLQTSTTRSTFKCSLDDLAEYRPALAKGLRALLDFDGDVAETFCYDFVAQTDRYGEIVGVPLCPGGEKRPVTNSNRREFVDLYVHYLLDTAVARQFEPFKRGFFTVCGGNALSLFRPEEIELLVRGSDEPLDVTSLRAVATYDNWNVPNPASEPAVRWFWEFFIDANPQAQRKILSFITGSDRIPAMGATSLTIRLACLGDDAARYPTARTCFNTLGLYRYGSKEKLEQMLWGAVVNSEGFGLK